MCKLGKNQISVVVVWMRPKFWCMIAMGVKHNHTKCEQETQHWRLEARAASGGPKFQILSKMPLKLDCDSNAT